MNIRDIANQGVSPATVPRATLSHLLLELRALLQARAVTTAAEFYDQFMSAGCSSSCIILKGAGSFAPFFIPLHT